MVGTDASISPEGIGDTTARLLVRRNWYFHVDERPPLSLLARMIAEPSHLGCVSRVWDQRCRFTGSDTRQEFSHPAWQALLGEPAQVPRDVHPSSASET
jgi:hypothetical protein